ncbi:hypothetical protein ACFQ1S_14335, partial [Kibdelosporangium lantanae]
MCLSVAPASFSETIQYVGRKNHPWLGRIEVLGYQNRAQNLHAGPNAMVLHIPARLTEANFIDVSDYAVLQRMVSTIWQPGPGGAGYGSYGGFGGSSPVQVFDHGTYTILVAENPTKIPAALKQVPRNRRPQLRRELFRFYARNFPNHSLVLCCFDGTLQADPLLMWYPPADERVYVLPSLDGHTGRAPDLEQYVSVDHWLVFGGDDFPEHWGRSIEYPGVSDHVRSFLPDRITGTYRGGGVPNGDFAISRANLA